MRQASALIALLLAAGCIDKPVLPSERGDAGAPGGDGGDPTGDAGPCSELGLDAPVTWEDSDQIRFDRDVGKLNPDCLDDLVIPGARGPDEFGVFVVLGRPENMLVEGYDSFVDTGARVAADVNLSDLVGGPDLDLVVLATEDVDGVGQSAVILVYEGDGAGGFDATFVANTSEGLVLAIGDFDSPQALYVETLQTKPGDEASVVFGDGSATRTLSPDDWNDNLSVRDTDEVAPAGVGDDMNATDLFVVESGTPDVEDVVLLAENELNWYARTAPDAYASTTLASPPAGIGRAAFGDIDEDGESDVAYARNQFVVVNLLRAPDAAGEAGDDDELPFLADPTYDALNFPFEDIQLAQLDGDQRGDLLLVDGDPGTGTRLWVYPNLEPSGAEIVNDTPGALLETSEMPSSFMLNRAIVGRFSDPDFVDVLVVGSKPSVVAPHCVRPDVSGDGVALELCP